MVLALEVAAGLAFAAALATTTLVLIAFELGRMVTMDDEQREPELRAVRTDRGRRTR
jgi:hypothetical protein